MSYYIMIPYKLIVWGLFSLILEGFVVNVFKQDKRHAVQDDRQQGRLQAW